MTEMPNKEVLNFNRPEESKDFPVQVDGTSALKLDVADEVLREEKGRDAQIGEIREFVKPERPQAVLPLTNTDAGVQRAPRGVVGPVGNQGRETSGGDRTGGRRKKGLGFRITAGVMAVVAGAGIGYGVFKDKINSFFGGGVDPNDLPPTYPIETPGEMPSQSENIDSPTPSAEETPIITETPIVTEAPTPTIDQTEVSAQKKQDFINKTGEYTYENIKNKLYSVGAREDKIYNLGVVTYASELFGHTVVQGWLFGYREENGNLILEVGFDNKDNTKGIIKDVIVPVEFYQNHLNDGIGLSFWDRELWQRADSGSTNLGIKNDMSSIKKLLSPFEDKPMLFTFYSAPVKNIPGSEKYGEEVRDLENLFTENLSAVNSLLTEITNNDVNVKIGNTEGSDSSSLILVLVEACFD